MAAAVDRARAGSGSPVVVEGAAGTGKSALLFAAAEIAASRGLRTLSARGGELEREHPFGVVRQLYDPLFLRADAVERERLLAGAAAPAGWILAGGEHRTGREGGTFAVLHALYWLTANLSRRTPILLTLDDLHWADTSSLRALDYLARRLDDVAVVLIMALRTEEPGAPAALLDTIRSAPAASVVRLGPLRDASVAEIARRRFPAAGAALCQALAETTGGNPLLLQELLRVFSGREQAPSPEAVRRASLPTLGERVLRRAAGVDEQAPALVRAMAVLDDGAPLRTAAALAGMEVDRAAVVAHGLWRTQVLDAEDPIAFVHPLVRRSIYDDIPAAERHRVHERAATILEAEGASPERVAAHLGALPAARSPRVARALHGAAERALEQAAPDEAVHWLERALEERAPEPPEAQLVARLAVAKTLLRDPGAIPLLERAYELLDDPRQRGRIAGILGYTLALGGQWEATISIIERARSDLPGDDPEVEADLAGIQACVELYDPALIESFERRRQHYEQIADGDGRGARSMAALLGAEAALRGRVEDAQRRMRQARQDDHVLSESGGGWAPGQLLFAAILIDDIEDSAPFTAELRAAAESRGAVLMLWVALAGEAWRHARRGDLAAAEADVLTLLSLSRLQSLPMALGNVALFVVDVALERDAFAWFAQEIEQAEVPPEFLRTWAGANLLEARGRVRVARREREAGIADLRAAGRTASALGFGPNMTAWQSALALALPGSEREEALALAEEELALGRESGLARPVGMSLRTLGLLAARADDQVERLRESVAVLEGSPARLELARSLVALGGALRRSGKRSEARPPLEAGSDLARACGAHRLAQRAHQELLAAGGRRRGADPAGRDALTASELRVAKLAVAGASNAEIAQTLFVSLKTIETHLSSAYAKLGLSGAGSRPRLAQALTDGRR